MQSLSFRTCPDFVVMHAGAVAMPTAEAAVLEGSGASRTFIPCTSSQARTHREHPIQRDGSYTMLFDDVSVLDVRIDFAKSSISRLPQGAKSFCSSNRLVCWTKDKFMLRRSAAFDSLLSSRPFTWIFIGDPSSFIRQTVEQASCFGVGPSSTATTQRPHLPTGVSLGW